MISEEQSCGKNSKRLVKLHPHVFHPERDLNIRICDPATFQVIVESTTSHYHVEGSYAKNGSVLGSVGYSRAFFELHEGAIYMHQGKQYLVTHLNLDSLLAKCIPVRVPYYTSAHNDFQIDILRKFYGHEVCGFGMVTVKCTVSGFVKLFRDVGGGRTRVVWGGECSLPQLVSRIINDSGICLMFGV